METRHTAPLADCPLDPLRSQVALAIIERNIATVRELGFDGWDKLLED